MSRESLRFSEGGSELEQPASRSRGSPEIAVRGELRAALHDLSDALLSESSRTDLLDAIRHAWILADLADLDEGQIRSLLRNLQRELMGPSSVDSSLYANQLTLAASRL